MVHAQSLGAQTSFSVFPSVTSLSSSQYNFNSAFRQLTYKYVSPVQDGKGLQVKFQSKKWSSVALSRPKPLQCLSSNSTSGNASGNSNVSSALTPELKEALDKFILSNKVVLFMKGTKEFPQCGFSNTVVQILRSLNVPFQTFNVLENELLRQGLKEYSKWPTFPQLYIDGEFFGGCDITIEAYKTGELQELLEKAICS
eukprot:TRINITY_DN36471_c0_g1_i1.p1 TRINITY_DN36471_c0_g1~~TRINITY_DN36471_c0_g1_i1.p1  ORF type:complete len:199 (+),score=35.16 TRINITY_DN36471_c0_g1_i1:36-632(+)